jgi:hypothetical protein
VVRLDSLLRRVLAATIGVVGLCGGCASGPSSLGADSGAVAPSGSGGEVPELAFRGSATQEAGLLAAVDAAITTCMASAGFSFFHPTLDEYVTGIAARNAQYGWAFPRGDPRDNEGGEVQLSSEPDPNGGYLGTLTDDAAVAWDDALSGSGSPSVLQTSIGGIGFPTSGCRAEAWDSILGADGSRYRVAQTLVANAEPSAHSLTIARPEVAAASKNWVDCMSARGYEYESFVDARYAYTSVSQTQFERIASADRACSDATGLASTYRTAYNEEFTALYEQNRELVDEYLAVQAAALQQLGL